MYFTDQIIMQMGDAMELTFEGLEMEKRNLPTDRVQRADEKNWVTCPVIISISGSLGKIIKCIWNFYFALSENGLCYWILPLAWCQFLKIKNFGIFFPDWPPTTEVFQPYHFLKELSQVLLNIWPKPSAKRYKK